MQKNFLFECVITYYMAIFNRELNESFLTVLVFAIPEDPYLVPGTTYVFKNLFWIVVPGTNYS